MLFRKPKSAERTVYAVGDVHGRLDLLELMLERISEDVAGGGERDMSVIFLGDYVDRGPHSHGVINRLSGLQSDDAELRFLKGNHEASLLAFLQDPKAGPAWCAHGGVETLASYGVFPPGSVADEAGWRRAQREFQERLPEAHAAFLNRLELFACYGDYMFVHAGVRPGRAIEEQDEEDLLWIRDDFLNDRRRSGKIVVHGHTPQSAPFRDGRRIGVDTGAYMSGMLTCARIEDGEVRFLFAKR